MTENRRPVVDDGFRELVRAEQPRLLRLAYGVTGRWASAEDAVQAGLEKAYSAWHLVRRAEDRTAYVRRIVVREAVREAKRQARWGTLEPAAADSAARAVGSPEDRLDLAAALAGLSPKQRAVVVLRYVDDLPVAEVARTLSVGEGTVKRQCHDALHTLRGLLGPRHVEEASDAR
ncbi:RNA polymerase sigma factor [Jannaschia sp. R86511]|uniref:RNA polymerase sigma factor n=1 Tax=Jannaschia sp. R86511 TaxID=3093853 RepID=UPI0036D28C2F